MAKAFKWLLPGAVKKKRKKTKKKTKKIKQNVRKETKMYSSAVIFNHFFLFIQASTQHIYMHVTDVLSKLQGN